MRKKLLWTIAALTGILFLWIYLDNFYELLTKSYYIDESSLCKIDTFHLSARAFEQSASSGTKYNHPLELIFKSTNGFSFSIEGNTFEAIRNKQKLEDTLMYHDTKFTIYSDKESYRRYQDSKSPIFLAVYQIQIDGIKYVDIKKMNQLSKSDKKQWVIEPPFFILIFGLLILWNSKGNDRRTKWKRTILYISCFVILTGIILLT